MTPRAKAWTWIGSGVTLVVLALASFVASLLWGAFFTLDTTSEATHARPVDTLADGQLAILAYGPAVCSASLLMFGLGCIVVGAVVSRRR